MNNIPTPTSSTSQTEETTAKKLSQTNLLTIASSAKPSFYDFYLDEHQNMACRRLHFAGSSFGLIGLAKSVKSRSVKPLLKGIAAG